MFSVIVDVDRQNFGNRILRDQRLFSENLVGLGFLELKLRVDGFVCARDTPFSREVDDMKEVTVQSTQKAINFYFDFFKKCVLF